MAYRGLVFGAVAALLVTTSGAVAQAGREPVNLPPASFTGNQFIDNNGCAFIRAGISGVDTWIPRVDRSRTQLCNFQPTFGSIASLPEIAPLPDLEPATAEPAAPRQVATTAPAAPTPRQNVGAPIQTVASLTTAPRIGQAAAPARTPQVVRSEPTPAPQPAKPEPRRLTLAQACAEIAATGTQLINGNTGKPVVCPRAEPVQTAAAAAPQPRRMTIEQICAETARTGRTFINAATNQPIACSAQIASASPQAPAAVQAPAAPSLTAQSSTFQTSNCSSQILKVHGRFARCAPGMENALPGLNRSAGSRTVQATRSTVSTSTTSFDGLFGNAPVPASNPRVSTRQVVKPPKGYTRVWNDGRHNPNRGLPRAVAPRLEATVSSRSVAPAAPSHRFVQVGAFADADNARLVGQRFMSQGLPVGLGAATSNGRAVKVVMLGPFSSQGALDRALRAARSAGYGSAYTRN